MRLKISCVLSLTIISISITLLLCFTIPEIFKKTFVLVFPVIFLYKLYFRNSWKIAKIFLTGKYRSIFKNIDILRSYPFNDGSYAKKIELLLSIDTTLRYMKGTDNLYKCLAFQRICSHILDGEENVLSKSDKFFILLYNMSIAILLCFPFIAAIGQASGSFIRELWHIIHDYWYLYILEIVFIFLIKVVPREPIKYLFNSASRGNKYSYIMDGQNPRKVDEIVFYIYSTYELYEYFSFCAGYRDSYIYASKVGFSKSGKIQRFICKDVGLRKEFRYLYSTFVPVQIGRNYLLPFDHREQNLKFKEVKLSSNIRIFLLSYFEYIMIMPLMLSFLWLLSFLEPQLNL